VTKIQRAIVAVAAAGGLAWASVASAQLAFTNLNPDPKASNAAFALQNPNGPAGTNYQVNYPYPGQCVASTANQKLFPGLLQCAGGSFAGPSRTAGGWDAGAVVPFYELQPMIPNTLAAGTTGVQTPKFVWEVLNPPDYKPDNATNCDGTNCPVGGTFPGADYYEIGVHEAWGFQALANLGAFPNPLVSTCQNTGAICDPANPPLGCSACNAVFPGTPAVPNGMQWTGLTCNISTGCTCPPDAGGTFRGQYCSAGGKIPYGYPLYTPIWGVGQMNMGGTLGQALAQTSSPWSQNNYIATWPSISIRAKKGTPVVVKWVNEFPNSHVLCPHPEAADWPCAIDRTFMGVKALLDPAIAASQLTGVGAHGVNPYGGPQQPDNSWVTHLHGGEIPPSTDGFAEKWFGNTVTAGLYNDAAKPRNVFPPFENPSHIDLVRPAGNSDTYTYPMVQEEATIWFHDHTLGKTHHNVIAGPAGFFPVKEPLKHGPVAAWTPPTATVPSALPPGAEYTWLDPVTEPRGVFGIPVYDQFYAIQDRAFNDDGSINFSNGLGQPVALPGPGLTAVTNGVNPQVHPTWVPEYFGDVALVNGVAWPKKSTEPGWYRLRLVDGSDSRCWTIGFQQSALPPAPGAAVTYNVPFYVIANDQGYLRAPVKATQNRFTMCPGERYEVLVNFGALPGVPVGGVANVWMVNNAKAPFPAGIAPQGGFSPDLNVIMQFAVNPVYGPGVKSCGQTVKIGRVTSPIAPAAMSWVVTDVAAGPSPADMATNLATAFAVPAGFNAPAGLYSNICMPADPSLVMSAQPEFDIADIRAPLLPSAAIVPAPPLTFPTGTIVRQVYLNEKVDGLTATPLGMQLNGVPFEYKVTETPKLGTKEVWQFVNLTVDAHPMHPHLVRHLVVARQTFNVGQYKAALCGSTTCQPGPAPGGEMQVVPNVNGLTLAGLPFLTGNPVYVRPTSVEGGFKDVVQAPPGMVTTIIADWTPRWNVAGSANAPGTVGCANGTLGCTAPYIYEPATSAPYVWHCHINSHEDSEMMRTSLVVQ